MDFLQPLGLRIQTVDSGVAFSGEEKPASVGLRV